MTAGTAPGMPGGRQGHPGGRRRGPHRGLQRKLQRRLWLILLVAALASLPVAAERWRLEGAPVQVELVADLEGLEALARQTGTPLREVVAGWQQAGVTSLALPPYNLADVAVRGVDYLLFSGSELIHLLWLTGAGPDLGGLPLVPNYSYLVFLPGFADGPLWRDKVLQDMVARPWGGGPDEGVRQGRRADGGLVYAFPVADPHLVHQAFLGLSPVGLELVSQLGMRPVPRWSNRTGRAGEAVQELVDAVPGARPGLVIFSGSEALGFPYRLHETAQALKGAGMPVGWVEFTRQRGLAHLITLLDGQAVRVHSISEGEMARLSVDSAVRRWNRAVRERGIRALYMRPFLQGAGRAELVAHNQAYVEQVVRSLQAQGATIGPARPLGRWNGPLYQLVAGSLGVGAAAALLFLSIVGALGASHPHGPGAPGAMPQYGAAADPAHGAAANPAHGDAAEPGHGAAAEPGHGAVAQPGAPGLPWWIPSPAWWPWLAGALVVLPPVLVVGLYLKGYTILARQGAAFAATLVFPVLAAVRSVAAAYPPAAGPAPFYGAAPAPPAPPAPPASPAGPTAAPGGPARPLGNPGNPGSASILQALATLVGITALGVIILIGFLADYRFLLGTEQYLGVKAAHALPVLAVAAIGFLQRREGSPRLRHVAREPIRWGHVIALAALGFVFLVYVLRTGHDTLGVGDWEVRLRLWLEQVLPVRPRSKEIFIGYPALLFGWAAARGWLGDGPQAPAGLGASSLRAYTPWFMAAGVVAPVSVLNSFAHAHTPLAVSALRSGLGLGVGLLIGGVLLLVVHQLVVKQLTGWRRPSWPASTGMGLPRP